jgi:RimJ/RimL family protein N-acetyltransferase
MTPPNLWQGQRVRLRAVEPGDWQTFFDWNADTDLARSTYFIPFPVSREAQKKWTAEQSTLEPKDHAFRWVIENLAGELVGTLNTHTCDPRNGTFRYGVAIRREHWRRGYASEAIRLVLAYFFRELHYQKVNVEIYAFNESSLKLHRKLGFKEEGRLRRMIYTGGAYHDEILLGLTAEEFEELQPEEM